MSARARGLATKIRSAHSLEGPPVSDALPYELAPCALWVKLGRLPKKTSGLLFREPDGAVIWLSKGESMYRRRWTLWHETGHLLLHSGRFHCDLKTKSSDAVEREADSFVVEMLMPRSWILRDLARIGSDVDQLADLYRVSRTAMEIRLREVGL